MITSILYCASAAVGVWFSATDSADAQLLARFASAKGVASSVGYSLQVRVSLECGVEKARKLTAEYCHRFGLKVSADWRVTPLQRHFERSSLSAEALRRLVASADERGWPRRSSNPRSLVVGQYLECTADHIFAANNCKSCTFVTRPWVSADGSRCTAVEGDFIVRKRGGTRLVHFLAQPG